MFMIIFILMNCLVTQAQEMNKIRIVIGKNIVKATLYDTPIAKEFLSQLPLKMELKDFASKEKISVLTKKLSDRSSASSKRPPGDIAYYAPWGNIAFFYKGEENSTSDLFILGRIDSGKEFLNVSENFDVKVEYDQSFQ